MTLPLSPASAQSFTWKPSMAQPAAPSQDAEQPGSVSVKFLRRTGIALLRRGLNMLFLLLICIGAGTVWDATIGDGPLPQLNNVKQQAPILMAMAQRNSTAQLAPSAIKQDYWQALTPSRQLLLSLSPQIAEWLENLHQQGHIETHEPEGIHQAYHVSADTPLLAAYRYNQNTLYLGQAFWQLSDGQKVAVITHEYRHSRQNAGKRISYQLAQWVGLGQLQNESPMENEARAYEREAELALGLN